LAVGLFWNESVFLIGGSFSKYGGSCTIFGGTFEKIGGTSQKVGGTTSLKKKS